MYRSDLAALAARLVALDRVIDRRTREREELAYVIAAVERPMQLARRRARGNVIAHVAATLVALAMLLVPDGVPWPRAGPATAPQAEPMALRIIERIHWTTEELQVRVLERRAGLCGAWPPQRGWRQQITPGAVFQRTRP